MSSTDSINITFENIQSIMKGEVNLKENAINIKYGYNGLGKSSIGKAIEYKINGKDEEIAFLAPYTGGKPVINISKEFKQCTVFNKEYISNWLFKENTAIIDDSYSIFFNNKELKEKENDINELLKSLVLSLDDKEISEYVVKCEDIKQNLKTKKDNSDIQSNCNVAKGFKNGPDFIKKLEESKLKDYSKLISSVNSPNWFKWFKEGCDFVIDEKCPYCLNKLNSEFSEIQECIKNLVEETDFKKNIVAKETVLKLATICDSSIRKDIVSINEKKDCLTETEKNILISNFNIAINEEDKIYKLKNQSKVSLISINKSDLLSFYNNNKLDESYFQNVDVALYNSVVRINESINNIISKIEDLIDAVTNYNNEITASAKNVNNEINNFLKYAGIPYKFEIRITNDDDSETIIRPLCDNNTIVSNADRHLSYGEMNSFSLALFGAINKRNESDLIILDDPISSFDENKKFAVMHYLFNQVDGVLKDKTVLLLTHDMEPLLDMVRADYVSNHGKDVYATMIDNIGGVITEKSITNRDIKSSIQQELDLAKDSTVDDYLRMIHFRRYLELNGDKNNAYEVASNAEHLREKPIDRRRTYLLPEVIEDGCKEIIKVIDTFNYEDFVSKYDDKKLLTLYDSSSSNYDKVRLVRPLLDHNKSKVSNLDIKLWNFITENFHIENMYLYGVCGKKQIPDYIVDLCDELVSEIRKIVG